MHIISLGPPSTKWLTVKKNIFFPTCLFLSNAFKPGKFLSLEEHSILEEEVGSLSWPPPSFTLGVFFSSLSRNSPKSEICDKKERVKPECVCFRCELYEVYPSLVGQLFNSLSCTHSWDAPLNVLNLNLFLNFLRRNEFLNRLKWIIGLLQLSVRIEHWMD